VSVGGILLKNADPPLDDFNLTITWDDGGGPCKCIEAWDGVNWTPLAQVMSRSMCGRAWPCALLLHSPFEWPWVGFECPWVGFF